jgi:hypothetical protein
VTPMGFRASLVRAGFTAAVETPGGILQYLPDELEIGESLAVYGEYLQIQLDRLARLIKLGQVVIEVGAGVGAHALMLSRAIGSEGQLFLYESRSLVQRICDRISWPTGSPMRQS